MRNRLLPIFILIILLSACGRGNPAPESTPLTEQTEQPSMTDTALPSSTPTPTETATPTPTELPSPTPTFPPIDYGPNDFPANVNPLTGLPVSDPALLERRPVAIKVQLFPRGQRPPWNITLADIVFDFYQNFGLTRLHAIYYGNDAEQVGPIRSARILDGKLTRLYKSIFAFGGADRRILNLISETDYGNRLILEGSSLCPAMCRIDPNGFNYLVANTKELSSYASNQGIANGRQDLTGMRFVHQAPEGGASANQVYVRYSISAYVRWDYDPEHNRYLRFQDSVEASTIEAEVYDPLIERDSEIQVSAENVIVIFVPHQNALGTAYGQGEIIDILIDGVGPAYAFRDGQVYRVNWIVTGRETRIVLTNQDGSLYPFKPGKTWFQVIGQSSTANEASTGIWRFENKLP